MGQLSKMIEEDYRITHQGIATCHSQANAIIERIYQTCGNIIRSFEVHESDLTAESPWDGILSAAIFALRATYHTTLQATPSQLVFGSDAILNVKFEANWQLTKQRKPNRIHKDNLRVNNKRIPHEYKVGDKVLYQNLTKSKYGENPYSGPYIVQQVNNNGTVHLSMGAITEVVSIRLIKPYKE